jgi:AcrR family transcriptional regulator
VDGRRARGDRTRAAVVNEAVQLASVDGLEGLTIAHLAGRLGVPKSSAHTAFGSKAELQVAVLRRTREILIEHVIAPSLTAARGRPRLDAVGEAWLTYLAGGVFEGGCVLSSASTELDGRPGLARDELVAVMTEWLGFLAGTARDAIKTGDFDAKADPTQIAFELQAIGMTANWHHQLFGGDAAFHAARVAWSHVLERHAAGS